jgi:PAS domain S-box-containing protein
LSFIEAHAVGLLTDLPEALIITTSSGEIVFFNKSASEQSGFSSTEMLGEHISRMLPESSRRKVDVVTWFERWAENPDPEQLRYLSLAGIRKNGDERRYQVRVSKFEDNSDIYFAVVLRDITREQDQTAQLRHAQLISNRIIAIGEDAVLSIDGDHKICLWNKKAESLFGYEESEILGESINILIPEAFHDTHTRHIRSFSSDKIPSKYMGERSEILGAHKSGALIPLEASITKTYVDNKLIMSAQVRDITERKQALKTLEDSEARFRAIFDHAVEAIALLDESGLVIEINRAATDMLPLNEYVGDKYLWELTWWGTNDSNEKLEAQETLQNNVMEATQGNLVRTRTELSTSRGDLHIDFSLIPVSNANGEVIYIIAEARKLIEL